MLIDKLKSSPMYPTAEMGKQSKKNHWYVREKGVINRKTRPGELGGNLARLAKAISIGDLHA